MDQSHDADLGEPATAEAGSAEVKGSVRRPHGFDKFIKDNGFHCLYCVTTQDGKPAKIGIADDAVRRFASIQTANFLPLKIHRFWWVAGRPISERVEAAAMKALEAKRIRGEWFDCHGDDMAQIVEAEIAGIGTWAASDADMVSMMERQQQRLVARIFRA